MKNEINILMGAAVLSVLYGNSGNCKRIVCYFNSTNTLGPEDIDVSLCTHLVYKAAILDSTKNEVVPLRMGYDLEENGGKGLYKRTVELKLLHPELKVLLAVGTWEDGSLKYSSFCINTMHIVGSTFITFATTETAFVAGNASEQHGTILCTIIEKNEINITMLIQMMASTGTGRRRFARSASDILRRHGFDGLSLDWEYPGRRGGGSDDRRNYDLLTFELRIELDRHGLILSGLLPQSRYWLEGYDIESVKRNFHYICLNTFNYWGPWWDYTGIAAPLMDVESSVDLYLAKKVPGDMIVVGIPAYAQTANLAYAFKNQRPQIIIGPGIEGPRSQTPGRLGYDEVVKMQSDSPNAWSVHLDETSQSPYAVRGPLYISYDDPSSVARKAHLIIRKKLGGAMIMSIDSDDFRGIGSNGTFPLTRTLHRILQRREEEE